VAHKQNGDPLSLQREYDLEQRVYFFSGKSRRGFIHYDELRVEHQRAADSYKLLISYGKIPHLGIQIDLEIDLGDRFFRDFPKTLPIHQFAFICQFTVKSKIFHNRHIRKYGKVLIDHLYAVHDSFDRGDFVIRSAAEFNIAGVRGIYARNDFDKRRFSAAVLTCQAVDLSRRNFQRYSF
jgi:hypothetical protein